MVRNSPSTGRTILWIAVLVILLGAAIMAATLARSSLAPTGSRRVTFRVESTGGYANITIKAGSFHIDDPQTMTTPWEKTVDVARAESVFLTAANPTQTGQLTCKIYLDHQIWKTETIPAPKDGVACAGIIP